MRGTLLYIAILLSHSAFPQTKDLNFKHLSVENSLPKKYATACGKTREASFFTTKPIGQGTGLGSG